MRITSPVASRVYTLLLSFLLLTPCCFPASLLLLPGGAKAGGGSGGAPNLFSGAYRKGVVMGCILFVFQQFSGINAIVYFSSSVFKQASKLVFLILILQLLCLSKLKCRCEAASDGS